MLQARTAITRDNIERFRHRAVECRAQAEIEPNATLRREREETARAYERMAERAERFLPGE